MNHACRSRTSALSCLIATVLFGACALPSIAAGPRLLVHAGAGIRPPLDEIGALYEKKTGTRVDYNFKGSGCLLVDISISKKGDVYIPGESFYMDQARQKKLVGRSRIVAGMNTVLIVPRGNPEHIARVKDLTRPGLRVGMGDFEAVAAGKAAKEVLQKAGVLEGVQRNRVMSALNVIELGNAVKLGHLDAAIVWDATAALYKPNDMTVIPLPKAVSIYSPIPAAPVSYSTQPKEAEKFIAFLQTPEARAVFVKHGYQVPVKGGHAADVTKHGR